jgi:hypothetical protein
MLFLINLHTKQEQATGNKSNGNSREGRTTERIIFDYAVLRFLNNTGVGVVSSIMPWNDFWYSNYLNNATYDFHLCSMIVRLDSGLNSRFVHGIKKPQSQRSMQNFKEHTWQLFYKISSKSTKRFKM